MATKIFTFTSASSNLATFKAVDFDAIDSAYATPSLGHVALSFSATSDPTFTPTNLTLGLAWCDCNTSGTNAILGVTKYTEITLNAGGARRSSANNASGNYVFDATQPIRIVGLGPCIDMRSSPVLGIRRILMVGLVAAIDTGFPVTVLVTPTRIA